MKNIFLLTMALLLNGLWLKAQTPCPNRVTNGDFEVGNTGFQSDFPFSPNCQINSYNVTTNFNLKCANFPSFSARTNPGTGKFLVVQGSFVNDAWRQNVTVTPNTPYTFSFWASGTVPYSTNLTMLVNNVDVNFNNSSPVSIVTSPTSNWVKYTFSGITPASVGINMPISIRQLSAGEAYSYGIDDIVFTLCSPEPPCVSCVGNVSSPNLVTNGSFTNGNVGFTSALGSGVPSASCGTNRFGVTTGFPTFCNGWGPLAPHSGATFLALDGDANPAVSTVLWQTPVTLTANTDYCFSFYWALAFAHPSQNFPISIDIVNSAGVIVANANAHVGDLTVATNLNWTQKIATWSSGSLTGAHFIAIRQLTGSIYRDWAIDDICFTKKAPTPCDAAFTSAAVGSCGNYQFTNTSTPTTGLTYAWLFGDPNSGNNNTSSLQNPTHQFTTCGSYIVRLIIEGTDCRDTVFQTITVTPDNVVPVARCKPNLSAVFNVGCEFQFNANFVDNGSTDNCRIKSLSVSPSVITRCGNTTVTFGVEDWCGNISTCTTNIQVTETVPPVIVCPPNTTVTCDNVAQPSLTGTATATDNCPGTIVIAYTDAVSGTMPCEGLIRRTWTAKDTCGNVSSCIQTISVRDIVPPIITNCPTNQTVNTILGQCYYTFLTPLVITATDNCDPTPSVSCTWTDPLGVTLPLTATTQFPKGVSSIKCTARDKCNNVSRDCFFTLTVVDNELPKITCPSNIVVVGTTTPPPASQCKAVITGLKPTATDNCPMLNVTYALTSVTNGSTSNGLTDASGFNFMGTSSLTYTATDMAGNTASCSSTVTVLCDSCGCGSGGTLSQNLIVNGNFALGNVGFTSGLPYDNNTGCVGSGNRYGVRNTLPAFCGGWANTTARTQPNCLILDGSETGAAVLWKNQNPFSLTQGASYCFSFWWTSAYDSNRQPSFPIQVDIVDALGNVVAANIGTENIAQLPTGVWVNKTINWTSTLPTGGGYHAVIRQLSGSLFRDFAIDDICFTRNTPPPTCVTEFSFQPNGCGKYTFSGFANGTPTYTYTWNFDDPTSPSNIVTGTSTSNTLPVHMHQFEVGGPHTVTLTITDATGCTNTSTRLINVPTLPTATITGNLSVCSGQTTTLTASGGGTYQWLPSNQTTASITVTPAILNNTYSVIVTDANGCKDTAKVTVTIKAIPGFVLPNQTICQGQNATLTAAGGGTYAWTPGGQTTVSITVTPSVSTIYTCVVTASNGCSGMNSATVTVNPKPTVTITGNKTVCQGLSTTLTASGGGTYQWLPSNQSSASINVTPSVSTTYTLITTGANGCKDTTLVSVKVISCGCPDSMNIVKNGSFESGTPSGTDESIGLATNWGRIWPAPYGQSTADFWNTGVQNPMTGIGLTTPTPASQSQFAGFWLHNTTVLAWREGILSSTFPTIAQNSGIYDLSLKLACLDNSIAGASLSIFGVPSGISALTGTNPLTGNTPTNPNLFTPSAVLLKTYPIPTGCTAAFTTLNFQFNANLLPSQGIERIFLTRTDGVSGKAYVAVDDICLTPADTCICGSFTGVNYRPTQGAPQQFVTCGDTLSANCTLPNWTLGGNFQCAGSSCPPVIEMKWILRGGGTTQTGTMTGPNFNMSIPTSHFSVAGLYNLELQAICGRDTCRCNFIIRATGCPCCQNRDQFIQAVNNAVSISIDNTLCKATVNIGALPSCDEVRNIQWGDNTNSAGPFTAGTMPMHTYSGSGTYVISFLAIERNPLTGLICFEYQRRDTIRLMCTPSDTCECRGFANMSFYNGTWAQPLSKPAKCDSSYTLPCTDGNSVLFHGNFLCSSQSCLPDSVSYAITQGSNVIQGGKVRLNPWGLAIGHFDIIINLNPALFTTGVQYTITVTGMCGSKVCTCKVNFTFAPCPCPCLTLAQDVAKGFKTLGVTAVGCKKTVMPIGLCPNDVVTWMVGGSSVGTSAGNASFTITFTSSGIFTVCMAVTRLNPDGSVCNKFTYCRPITVNCLLPIINVTHCTKNSTTGNGLKNGNFTEGVVEGHLLFGGVAQNWTLFPNTGDGFVMADATTGASDGGHLIFNANNSNRAGVFQQITLPISTFTVLEYYARNYSGTALPAGTVLEFRLYNEPIAGSPSQLIYSDTIPKDSLAWMRRTFSPRVNPDQTKRFFNICLSNNSTTDKSSVGVDNVEVCSSATVDTKESTVSGQIQIVPNPNQGTFTVVLSERATLGMKLRILNSMGQFVQDFSTKLDNEQQTIQAHHLPNGMYFLQVLSEGKVIGVEKFVKQ